MIPNPDRLSLTQPPIQRVPGLKSPEREANHSSPSSAKVYLENLLT